MHTENVQELKELLLKTDEAFRQLATQHHELEDRLHELSGKAYLSEPEQVEEVTLKKRKLHLKDRMEDILRRQNDRTPSATRCTMFKRSVSASMPVEAVRFTPISSRQLLLVRKPNPDRVSPHNRSLGFRPRSRP